MRIYLVVIFSRKNKISEALRRKIWINMQEKCTATFWINSILYFILVFVTKFYFKVIWLRCNKHPEHRSSVSYLLLMLWSFTIEHKTSQRVKFFENLHAFNFTSFSKISEIRKILFATEKKRSCHTKNTLYKDSTNLL